MQVYATYRHLGPEAPAPPLASGDLLIGVAAALVGLMEAALHGHPV